MPLLQNGHYAPGVKSMRTFSCSTFEQQYMVLVGGILTSIDDLPHQADKVTVRLCIASRAPREVCFWDVSAKRCLSHPSEKDLAGG